MAATPEDIGLEFRALEIPTEDGETLDAWLVPTERSRALLDQLDALANDGSAALGIDA